MEISGKIIAVLEARSGQSAKTGSMWMSQEYVLETSEQYPKRMCFNVWGEDKIRQFGIQVGQELTVSFDIDAREYQGRWYNSLRDTHELLLQHRQHRLSRILKVRTIFLSKTSDRYMTKLYLVRHGETEENVKHILQGHMPGTLTQQGIEQAKEAVSQISDTAFDVCLCSDLKRCVDTVNILLEQRKDVPVIFSKLLRERDWGSITGVVVDREKGVEMPADVESLPAIRSRAKVFLDYVLQHYDGKNVLVVSHGFMLRIIQAVWRNVEHKEIVPMKNVEIRELVLCEE